MVTIKSVHWMVIERAIRKAFNNVEVNYRSTLEEEMENRSLQFWVNWPCWGDVDPFTAIDFADDLKKAGYVAEALTECELHIDYAYNALDCYKSVDEARERSYKMAEAMKKKDAKTCAAIIRNYIAANEEVKA